MTPSQALLRRRIEARARLARPDLARRLLAAYDTLRRSLTEAELLDLIRSGQAEAVVEALANDDILEAAFREYRVGVDRAMLVAADQASDTLPKVLRGPFDVLHPRIVEAVRTIDTRAFLDLRTEVRATVRQAVVDGMRDGLNPRRIARDLRGSIGLSKQQERWVRNFRHELETGDQRALNRVLGRGQIRTPTGQVITREAHAGGQGLGRRDLAMLRARLGKEPLTAEQIDKMVDAYRRRLIGLNTEAHTRSAALDAQRAGHRAAWQDVINRGEIKESDLRRRWLAVGGPLGDGRNRPEHLALHGTVVKWDEPYPNGQTVPGETDYGCRCQEQIFVQLREAAA